MAEREQTAAHRRTRDDHAQETAEDYVEAIAELIESAGTCRVTDLAARFGVTHVTVTRIISRLVREGFVLTEPHRPITLTPEGAELARMSKERHELVFRFLRAIGVSERVAMIDSEGIEHHVSEETLDRFRRIADERAAAAP